MYQTENKQLTFGGHPVTLRVVGGEVLVHCKNVIGTFTQAKAFVNNSNMSNIYPFGIKTTEPAFLTNVPGGNVRIACLMDTKEKFMELYHEAERMA
jgi:hypothetical protein